jgi:predicted AAA+ superfamily ATPase
MVRRQFWLGRIETAWDRRSVVWLHGVRRVGKTTLCQSLDRLEYLDCELPSVRRVLADPEGFLAGLGVARVALDEIHRLEHPTELLKIAADHFPEVKIVATGSSTLAATSAFGDTLSGRKVVVWLTPLMSRDLVDFGGEGITRRLVRGGLPPFFLGDGEAPAADFDEWIDSFWARDIQALFKVGLRTPFLRFVELLLVNSGGIFEASWYAQRCEVSRSTIVNYLGVLEATTIAHVVRPFTTRRATEIVKAPRVFAFDTGFVRHVRGHVDVRSDDLGNLWEHYVLNEVHAQAPGTRARYWRTKRDQEVDFVLERRGAEPMAVECKWSEASLGDLRGLTAFLSAYPTALAVVVVPHLSREYSISLGQRSTTVTDLAGLIRRLGSDPKGVTER